MSPEQLFELFYKNVTFDMNPPGFPKHHCEGMRHFWHERFMNTYYGTKEPPRLMSWSEAPKMWLAGYRENEKGHDE